MTENETQAMAGNVMASDRAGQLMKACGKKITPDSFRILSGALRGVLLNQHEKAALVCHLSMMDWKAHRRCAAWLLMHTGAQARNLAVRTDGCTDLRVMDMMLSLGNGILSNSYWRPYIHDLFAGPVPEDELAREKEIFEEALSADATDAVENSLLSPDSMARCLRVEDISIRLNIII